MTDVLSRLLAPTSLAAIHRDQVRRRGWPEFEAFDPRAYPLEQRKASARQWMRRAREEHGSIFEFTQVSHALTGARAPLEMLGALSRLITDEVRHAEICARMATAVWPEGPSDEPATFAWPPPRSPWPDPPPAPKGDEDPEPIFAWAADAILASCCIGETLSRPLFEAAATVTTDPVCESVLLQILKDEHLHARFGWEALRTLRGLLSDTSRAWLERRLSMRLGEFERSCACGLTPRDVAGTEVVIEPGDPARPNLSMLSRHQYATIFYATLEAEILPAFQELGMDATAAWAGRSEAR